MNGMNFGTDLVRNPKWNPLTSRVQGIGGGQGTVDTGVISSYTSNILCAGTGVCVAQGTDTKTASAAFKVRRMGKGVIAFGNIYLKIIVLTSAPEALAASTYVSDFINIV